MENKSNELNNSLVKRHLKLVELDKEENSDNAVCFVRSLLYEDDGRNFAYTYTNEEIEFLRSKYLSDYFKDGIRKILGEDISNDILSNFLDSDKTINEMTEEEVKSVFLVIRERDNKQKSEEDEKQANAVDFFGHYIFKLNGKGIVSYIKNNVYSEDIATQFLYTSGLNTRAEYYSGCGVEWCYLSEDNLIVIFNKLLLLDVSYALEFVEMINKLRILSPTNFIKSFYELAKNGFKNLNKNTKDSNIFLDGLYDDSRNMVGLVSVISSIGRDEDTNVKKTNIMKNNFMNRISYILKVIATNYESKLYNMIRIPDIYHGSRDKDFEAYLNNCEIIYKENFNSGFVVFKGFNGKYGIYSYSIFLTSLDEVYIHKSSNESSLGNMSVFTFSKDVKEGFVIKENFKHFNDIELGCEDIKVGFGSNIGVVTFKNEEGMYEFRIVSNLEYSLYKNAEWNEIFDESDKMYDEIITDGNYIYLKNNRRSLSCIYSLISGRKIKDFSINVKVLQLQDDGVVFEDIDGSFYKFDKTSDDLVNCNSSKKMKKLVRSL